MSVIATRARMEEGVWTGSMVITVNVLNSSPAGTAKDVSLKLLIILI